MHGPPHHGWVPPIEPPLPHQMMGSFNQKGGDGDGPTQPPMNTFKQFLSQQDDNITDEDAIKKYNEYKLDFRKQQIQEFFNEHKEEEWFRSKYHPDEYDQRKESLRASVKHRWEVFMKLMEQGKLQNVTLDLDKTDAVVRLLDTAVIYMEGGTDFDVKILDIEEKERAHEAAKKKEDAAKKSAADKMAGDKPDAGGTAVKEEKVEVKQEKKRKRRKSNYSAESGSLSESDTLTDSEDDAASHPPPSAASAPAANGNETTATTKQEKQEDSHLDRQLSKSSTDGQVAVNIEPPAADEEMKKEDGETTDEPKPRALHRTNSIFFRSLLPTITRQEIEVLCKKYPGFLRLALQDPAPERRFLRRGWATYDYTVNIKDICWDLTNLRVKDSEMGAIVNRELKQRVRSVPGITAHRIIAKQDIKLAAKIVQNFDARFKLWEEVGEEKSDASKETRYFGMASRNPVLRNITDYLVDEGSYEEEALLGQAMENKANDSNPEVTVERDDEVLKVLDRILLYLRIVHSIDFYNTVEYPYEDEMPHRCGLVHARGPPPPSKTTEQDVNDWISQFETRIAPYLESAEDLGEQECIRLGKKDPEAEVEKFIQANTQELGKDKWLCPLSGKKFKGPDFVRKHILNKNADKLDEVRKDVAYFNNYLSDPKRPQLPEHPSNKLGGGVPRGGGGFMPPANFMAGPPHAMMGYNAPRPPFYPGRRGGGGHGNFPFQQRRDYYRPDFRPRDRGGFQPRRDGNRSRPDPRGLIEYRDLDAPEDNDL